MRRLAFLVVLLSLSVSAAHAAVAPKGKVALEPFDYRGVTLDDGSMRRQFDETRDYYLRIPNDDLLKGFRKRAGLPAPGEDLTGWYGADTFHIFGQVVSGLARMYAATGDPACKAKVDTLIAEWAKCIEKDGYFFYSRKPNAPHYTYEKMVCGLVDAHLYCGTRDALLHLSTITDWTIRNLNRNTEYAVSGGRATKEWYTLSENLYRAYLLTGDTKYRDFGKVWEYTRYWDHFAQKTDVFSDRPACHAYSHVNTLSGAAAAYLVTGEEHYLDTLRNAYDYLQQNQTYATGGYGPDEKLIRPGDLPERLETSVNHFETQCGSWAGFKLSKYLISFTGDARYGDWIERLVINGIGASIPMSSDGNPFYYAGYSIRGAEKHLHPAAWACCAGTRPQAIADYYDLIYFRDGDSLCVNLFAPSTVTWSHAGQNVVLRQQTRFPEDETVSMTVSLKKPSTFTLKVRVPGWLAAPMTASVNGRSVMVKANAQHWADFRREWRDGDKLTLRLPMGFTSCRFPASSLQPYPAAIQYGPVVMAFRSPNRYPAPHVDFSHLARSFVKSPGDPLTFHLRDDANLLVRPFYAYKEGEKYYLYLDPSSAWLRSDHRQAVYSGTWGEGPEFRMTKVPGSSAVFTFEGTGVRWIGCRFDDAGKVEVRIDGEVVDVVDQYGPKRGEPFRWEKRDLASGKHTITLTLLADKNPESRDTFMNVASFDVFGSSQK